MVLVGMASIASAGVLNEDVSYWWNNNGTVQTSVDPDSAWLNQQTIAGTLLVKVQETVYDQASTQVLLARNDPAASFPGGYLYAYSLTNLGVGDASNPVDNGITQFSVNWQVAPEFVTISRQTLQGWTVTSTPAWTWVDENPTGLLPGDTAGGLWAISKISVDGVATASVFYDASGGQTISGQTTGPVPGLQSTPEPSGLLALVSGFVGLLTGVLRKR